MIETKTIPWNTEDHLETPEDIGAYLEAVFEDGEPELISHALGADARSKGITEIARRTGLGRQSLYKACIRPCRLEVGPNSQLYYESRGRSA